MLRKNNFQFFLLLLALIFALLAIFARSKDYFSLDLVISRHVQSIDFPLFDFLMRSVSLLGDVFLSLITIIASFLIIFRFDKRLGRAIFISSFGVIILSQIFKFLIARPRPDPSIIHQYVSYTTNDSFPSGHVLFFVGFYGLLTYITYRRFKKSLFKKLIISFFILLIFLAGMSRIYLGAHWFSDVAGSYLLGVLWLSLIIYLRRL